ncbi:unnamed protein product, partial [Pelagomonas calceolata]
MAEVLEAGPDGFDLSAELDATSISTTMKTCSACHEDKPQDAFSKKAWKARQVRRCVECTTADKPVTVKSKGGGAAAASPSPRVTPAKGKATPPRAAGGGDDTELPLDSPPFKAYERKHGTMAALHRSAEGGDGKAYAELGYIYAHGNGVVPDQETACKYWIAGAAIGDVECQGTLGARYCMGNGVPMDAAEGFRYYKMSADQGCVQGLNGMATCYENAEGVAQDLDEARRLLELALDKVPRGPSAPGAGAREGLPRRHHDRARAHRLPETRRHGRGLCGHRRATRRDGLRRGYASDAL